MYVSLRACGGAAPDLEYLIAARKPGLELHFFSLRSCTILQALQ